jgi:hypothetical protein
MPNIKPLLKKNFGQLGLDESTITGSAYLPAGGQVQSWVSADSCKLQEQGFCSLISAFSYKFSFPGGRQEFREDRWPISQLHKSSLVKRLKHPFFTFFSFC